MDWILTAAALFAVSIVGGHFTMGKKLYLLPTLEADFDEVAKKIMHSLFHYSSVFLVMAAAVFLYFSFEGNQIAGYRLAVGFAGIQFILNALVQIVVAFTSDLEKPFSKLFQWILFVATGCLSLISII